MLLPVELSVNGIIQYACFWVWLLSTHCYVWKVHPCCNVCCSLLSFPYHCLTVVQFVSAFCSWWTSGLCLGFLSYKLLLWAFSNPFLGATSTSVSPENNSHALFYCTLLFCASQICIFFYKLKLCDNSAWSDDGWAFLAIKYFYFIYLSVFGCAESSFWHRGSGALGLCSFSTLALVAPRHVGSSLTREQIPVPCVGRRILNHWTIRAVPEVFLKYVRIFF